MVEDNIRLVGFVLTRYFGGTPAYTENDDAFQWGCVGLCMAAMTYKPEMGMFSTYAVRCIQTEVYKQCIRINGNEEKREFLRSMISFDQQCTGDDGYRGTSYWECVPAPDEGDPFEYEDMVSILQQMFKHPDDKRIIELMADGCNQTEISQKLNVSRQRVSQRVAMIREKIRAGIHEYENAQTDSREDRLMEGTWKLVSKEPPAFGDAVLLCNENGFMFIGTRKSPDDERTKSIRYFHLSGTRKIVKAKWWRPRPEMPEGIVK